MHYNIGNGLQRPYESRYTIFRRFLVANPTLSGGEIHKLIVDTAKQHTMFRGSYYRWFIHNRLINMRIPLEQEHDYLDLVLSHDNYVEHKNNCPVCAQQCYHSDIFELPWVERCPIHNQRLVTQCPVCNNEWPDFEPMLGNDCPGCGRRINYNKLQGLFACDGYFYYNPIKQLYKFIQHKKMVEASLSSSFSEYEARSAWPDPNYELFPSYQIFVNRRISRNKLQKICTLNAKITRKKFTIIKLNLKEIDPSYFLEKTYQLPWIADERYQAVVDIAEDINKSVGKCHELEVFDFALYKARFLKDIKPFCPYCAAYSLWFYRICGDLGSYGVNSRSPLANLVEVSADNSPFRPVPMNLIRIGKDYYETSIDFQIWLYRRELRCSFYKIFHSVNEFCQKLKAEEGFSSKLYHIFKHVESYNIDDSVFIEPDTKTMKIFVYYQDDMLEDGVNLPHIRGATTQCNQFKKTEKIRELRRECKHDTTYPPISNGLTYTDYVKLEYGPLSRFDLSIKTTRFVK